MKKRIKQLGRDSLVYGIGGIAARGIGFFLLPVYTRIFSPNDYGTIEMLAVTTSFLSAFLGMGMDSAQTYFFFKDKECGHKSQSVLVSSILEWRLSWGLCIVLLAMIASPLINHLFFDGALTWHYFAIAFATALLSQITMQSAEVFRLLYRPWSYITVTLFNTISSAAVALTLIIGFDFGIIGFFIGSFAGAMTAGILGWWRLKSFLSLRKWHTELWPRLLRFGLPLMPTGLAMYVMTTSDRWFIAYYLDANSLGLYAVAAKFAMLISVAVITFRRAWWPIAMEAIQDETEFPFLRFVANAYLGLAVVAVIALTWLSPHLVEIMTGPNFQAAYPAIGVLAWYAVFYGFFLIISIGIWRSERTEFTLYSMVFAAILNIVLNYFLIPKYGIMGASLATAISFLVWNISVLFVGERLFRIGYNLMVVFAQIFLGVLSCCFVQLSFVDSNKVLMAGVVSILSIVLILYLTFLHSSVDINRLFKRN